MDFSTTVFGSFTVQAVLTGGAVMAGIIILFVVNLPFEFIDGLQPVTQVTVTFDTETRSVAAQLPVVIPTGNTIIDVAVRQVSLTVHRRCSLY